MGNFNEGELFLEKGLAHAARLGDLRTLGMVECCYGDFLQAKGDWKAVAEHSQKYIGYSEESKFVILLAWGWSQLGNAYSHLGDPERGRSYGERGLNMQQEAGIEWALSWQHLLLGDTHFQRGDLEKARTSVEEALRLSQKNNEKYYEAQAWILLGRTKGRMEVPHIEQAEECILQGMNIAEEMKYRPFLAQGHLFLGELYAGSSQKEKVVGYLTKAEKMFREMGMDYWLAETRKVSAGL
jgi:tetratricopeptide (TPR) repeat protein